MLKGIQKNVIVVRLTGSPCFEAAYFVLRRGRTEPRRGEMLREANRIISDSDPLAVKRGRRMLGRGERLLLVVYGALGGAISVAAVWLVAFLIF